MSDKFKKIDEQIKNPPKKKEETEKPKYEFDELLMYYAEPYEVNNQITIYQPSIDDIIHYSEDGVKLGEKGFYQMLNIFVTNPTSCRLQLWENGIDWNKISNFELFQLFYKTIKDGSTDLLFGKDFVWSQFEIKQWTHDDISEVILFNPLNRTIITEETYEIISNYLRTLFNIFPKVEKAKGKQTKEAIIEEEKMNLALKDDKYHSMLLDLISSACCHPGFKYKKDELKQIGIYEFMLSVQRLQIYEQSTALLKGAYSGFVDASKINQEEMNFMRNISHK